MTKPMVPIKTVQNLIEMGESSAHIYKLTQQKLLEFICKKAASAMGADASILWAYDARRERLFIRSSHNVSSRYVYVWNEVISMTINTGLIGRALKTNSIQVLQDISTQGVELKLTKDEIEAVNKEGFKTTVAIPYNIPSFKAYGAFNLYWRSIHHLSGTDYKLLGVLREAIYYSVDSLKHAFEFARQKPQLTALYKIFGGGIKLEGAQTAFQKIIDSLSRTLRARAAALWLYDEDEQTFSIFSATGLPKSFVAFSHTKEGKLSANQGFFKKLFTTKKISFYKSNKRKLLKSWDALFLASHLNSNYTKFLKDIRAKNIVNPTFIAIPIFIEGKMQGALIFYFAAPRTHSESELRTLRVAATHIGTALNNLHLYNTLTQESSKLEALFASLDVAVVTLDQEARFIKINPWGERLFALSQRELMGKQISEVDGATLLARVVKLFPIQEIRIHKHLSKELTWDTPQHIFEISATSVEGMNGEFFGVTYLTRDITRERLLEGMKTEFISLAAHQIRLPLTAIKWSLRSILDKELGNFTPEAERMLQRTYDSAEQLIQLTKELLDVSRIEEGRFFRQRTRIDFRQIIQSIVESSSVHAQQRKVDIQYLSSDQKLPAIIADEHAIRELISILLDNAIAYSLHGGQVRIEALQDERSIVISIHDTGVGIPLADQPYLFTRFFRATNVRKITEGTGLGLYFAKKVVEEYKGKIWFESEEKVGTTFHVSFPIPRAH